MKFRVGESRAFTIVELLIVIVVIAILAAITVVAYTGIQNQAYNSAVQSDLRQLAKQYELYRVEDSQDRYPSSSSAVGALGVRVTKSAYNVVADINLTFCINGDASSYAIAARVKSGIVYYVTPAGLQTSASTNIDTCGVPGLTRIVSGYWLSGAGGWRDWVNG